MSAILKNKSFSLTEVNTTNVSNPAKDSFMKNQTAQLNQIKPLGVCVRIAHGTANVVKKIGLGVAAAGLITPISSAIPFFAQKMGLIQQMGDRLSLIKEQVANLAKRGIALDAEAIANATCPIQEYVTQLNRVFRNLPELRQTVFSVKASTTLVIGIVAPVCEEIVFRCLIQNVLLKRIPQYIIKNVSPGKEIALDSSIAKAARIALTAILFSACHRSNFGLFPNSYVSMQLIATFVMGIGFGVLEETKAGLLGSISAHSINNIVAISRLLWSC
jgi:hypothetical protein